MKKSELASLIHQVIKEELEKEDVEISKSDPQLAQKKKAALAKNQTVNIVDPNNPDDQMDERKDDSKEKELKEPKSKKGEPKDDKEKKEPIHDEDQKPCTSCMAGKLAEIMDGFKHLAEAAKDAKHKRLAERLILKLEAANTALEALTAHENVLEEKETVGKEKNASKHIAAVEKELRKKVKDDEVVKKVLDKYPISKAVKVLDKMGEKATSEVVANTILKRALKEGLDSKKDK